MVCLRSAYMRQDKFSLSLQTPLFPAQAPTSTKQKQTLSGRRKECGAVAGPHIFPLRPSSRRLWPNDVEQPRRLAQDSCPPNFVNRKWTVLMTTEACDYTGLHSLMQGMSSLRVRSSLPLLPSVATARKDDPCSQGHNISRHGCAWPDVLKVRRQ
jgi:hypothetical protein